MNKKTTSLNEGEDFYWDKNGKMVLTASFLARRGYCCQSGCRHCPYGFTEKADPECPVELQSPTWETSTQNHEPTPEQSKYLEFSDLEDYIKKT